jgi:hypothetical protein
MSALGQKRTLRLLFDHLVGAGEHGRRNCEAKSFRGFEINHQLVLIRRLHWEVSRLLALEDAIDITGGTPILIDEIRPIGDQPAGGDEEAFVVDAGSLCRAASAMLRLR